MLPADIDGPQYTLTEADAGSRMRVRVIASNGVGTARKSSIAGPVVGAVSR